MAKRKVGPTMKFKDGDDYIAKLEHLGARTEDILAQAIFPAAAVVTDEIQKEISTLRVSENGEGGGLSAKQRAGLHNGLGIAELRQDGKLLNVKIGWDGYNDIKTKRWPKGQPNQVIARSVERGTSFMQANPFVKRAVARTRKVSQEKMQEVIDREIEKIMKKE